MTKYIDRSYSPLTSTYRKSYVKTIHSTPKKGGDDMKSATAAINIGAIVIVLGVTGLVSGDGRIGDSMNIDFMLDMTRIALGAILVIGGLKSVEASQIALNIFAVAYLGMFLLGLISPTLFGLVPSGLGLVDQILHFGGGILAIYFAKAYSQTRAAF